MTELDDVARRLASLSPRQREQVERELARRGMTLPDGLARPAQEPGHDAPARQATFSVFFFSAEESAAAGNGYRLLLDAAELADEYGFEAVWTPERHFHVFGGPYPAPSLLAAAVAARTKRVAVRAGSVVLPLHDPIRVAEEWAVVDNLSRGRAGVSYASGFHPLDFAFAPDNFDRRREVLRTKVEEVNRLWRGEPIHRNTGTGEADVRIYPRPLQPELPAWLTAGGETEHSFVTAAELGLNVLTALLNQNVDQLRERISLYRKTLAENGRDPAAHRVTLMIHTFIGDDADEVRETVRQPFYQYMRTHLDLARSFAASMSDAAGLKDYADLEEELLEFGFQRYLTQASLIGTPAQVTPMIRRLEAAGVDEIAALIDFGIPDDLVLGSLKQLAGLGQRLAGAGSE